jgi:hypothetical protein
MTLHWSEGQFLCINALVYPFLILSEALFTALLIASTYFTKLMIKKMYFLTIHHAHYIAVFSSYPKVQKLVHTMMICTLQMRHSALTFSGMGTVTFW